MGIRTLKRLTMLLSSSTLKKNDIVDVNEAHRPTSGRCAFWFDTTEGPARRRSEKQHRSGGSTPPRAMTIPFLQLYICLQVRKGQMCVRCEHAMSAACESVSES